MAGFPTGRSIVTAWSVILCALPPVARALEPLRLVHHYNVPGLRFGPAIPPDSPDHPLHPLHRQLESNATAARRRLQGKGGGGPPSAGTAPPGAAPSTSSGSSGYSAMALLGNVALTTVAGTVQNVHGQPSGTTKALPVGTSVYGPHEAGFGVQQDGVIASQMGCATPSLCYSEGGIDTKLSEAECAHACGITLPRHQYETYYGFLDDCGGHTEYHFHRSLSCLYQNAAGSGHSAQVAEGTNGARTPLYGEWEDFSAGQRPTLDACGGHFGVTPDSSGQSLYHNHVQRNPPFTFGCYGPTDANTLVTVEACRSVPRALDPPPGLRLTTRPPRASCTPSHPPASPRLNQPTAARHASTHPLLGSLTGRTPAPALLSPRRGLTRGAPPPSARSTPPSVTASSRATRLRRARTSTTPSARATMARAWVSMAAGSTRASTSWPSPAPS